MEIEENLFQQIPVCVLGDPPLHGIWHKSRAATLSEDPDTNKLQEASGRDQYVAKSLDLRSISWK